MFRIHKFTWSHYDVYFYQLVLTHTWKPGQPAVPFPGAPSTPWNSEKEKATDLTAYTRTHKSLGSEYDGWNTSVSPLSLPHPLTLSPIGPLSPGAPLIPLGPLGPWEMKGMMRLETYEMWQGHNVCWKHLELFKTLCVCVCVCVCMCRYVCVHVCEQKHVF